MDKYRTLYRTYSNETKPPQALLVEVLFGSDWGQLLTILTLNDGMRVPNLTDKENETGTGHESLSILYRYARNLLSVLDPSSLVRRARKHSSHRCALLYHIFDAQNYFNFERRKNAGTAPQSSSFSSI